MLAAAFGAAWLGGAEAEGGLLRMGARWTARTSFLFFAAAFFGSALHQLYSVQATRWLLKRRRQLGLAFAFVHGCHMAFVLGLWRAGEPLGIAPFSVGWLALVFVCWMVGTSNDSAQKWMGKQVWSRSHRAGGYVITYVFALSLWPAASSSFLSGVELGVLLLGLGCRGAVSLSAANRRRKAQLAVAGGLTVALWTFSGGIPTASEAEQNGPTEIAEEHALTDLTALEPDRASRERPSRPFGRAHPDAAPELRQFRFLIGEFACVERLRQSKGDWIEFRATWRGRYALGGFAIQDEYWTARVFATTLRVFIPEAGRWAVQFTRMPGYATSTWHGAQDGDTMVMRRAGANDDGPMFFDIGQDGFRWQSRRANPNWESRCRRTAGPE